MSKFFVGQRVRVVYAPISKFLIGKEAHVVDPEALGINTDGEQYVGVSIDLRNKFGVNFVAKPGEIEPILPEGSAPSEFTFQQLMDNLQEMMA